MPAPRCSASTTAAPTARSSASPITAGAAARTSRASACGASSPSAPCSPPARSSGRSCSAATTGRASCWPAPCAPTQPLRRRAGAARRGLHQQRRRLRARRPISAAPASQVAAVVDPRAASRRQHRARGQGRRCAPDRRRRGHARHGGRCACARSTSRTARRRDDARSTAISSASPAAGTRPCTSPPISAAGPLERGHRGLRARQRCRRA